MVMVSIQKAEYFKPSNNHQTEYQNMDEMILSTSHDHNQTSQINSITCHNKQILAQNNNIENIF